MARHSDAAGDRVDWGSGPSATTALTYGLWNRASSDAGFTHHLNMGKMDSGGAVTAVELITRNSNNVFWWAASNHWVVHNTTWTVTDDNWEMLLYRFDDIDNKAYANGSQVFTEAMTTDLSLTGEVTIFSRDADSFESRGDKAHAFWTSKALTLNQIGALFRGVNPFAILDQPEINSPLDGNDSPESNYGTDSGNGTLTGTSKSTSNPPVELLENYL